MPSCIQKRVCSPIWDPWDPIHTLKNGDHLLTSVEFTVTNLCNLRCEHCAVGDSLSVKEKNHIPVENLIKRLDEIDDLRTLSITGGEPALNPLIVHNVIVPLLKYADSRGVYTQVNSNLTLPLSRYEDWVDYVDVLHISYNYRDSKDFHKIVFSKSHNDVPLHYAESLYERMLENARYLANNDIFLSAESLLSPFTIQYLSKMHKDIVDMGCKRHEIHPLYPSSFAKGMRLISLDEYTKAIKSLLRHKDPDIWILLGTVPIFPCSDNKEDREFWYSLQDFNNVTVRQDPDGRNRLNIDIFSGNVYTTDFDVNTPLGNIKESSLNKIFSKWINKDAKSYHCCCPEARCLGPNILVASTYYPGVDFTTRKAKSI